MTQNVSTAVMQRRVEADDSLDDFPTPPWATRALIEYVIKPHMSPNAQFADDRLSCMTVREPCCNRGYMARPLAESFGRVIATDIYDYGWDGMSGLEDYLFPGAMPAAEFTITNPPFRLAEQILTRSFETPSWRGTAIIVRSAFLEGNERYRDIYSKNPPTIYAQFAERVIMTKGIVRDPAVQYFDDVAQKMRRPSTATSYCWLCGCAMRRVSRQCGFPHAARRWNEQGIMHDSYVPTLRCRAPFAQPILRGLRK